MLVPLVLAQWLFLLPAARSIQHNRWLFYQDGGETHLYSTAWSFAHGHLPHTSVGYGWPLLTSPIARIAGVNFLDALPALVLLQTLVLLPIALLAVYGIASRIGGRLLGYFTAVGWVVAPYLAIPLFTSGYHERYVDQVLPQGLGLTGLGNFPSLVFVLVAAYFTVVSMDTAGLVDAALAGIFGGFAIGIDPSNALFLAAPVAGYALARRPRAALAFGLALLPSIVALVLWKYRGLGHVPFHDVQVNLHRLELVRLDFRDVFYSDRIVEVPFLAGVIAIGRRSWAKSAFVAAWFLSFLLVKGSAAEASVETGSLFGLVMPAFPALLIACCAIPLLVPRVGPRLAQMLDVDSVQHLRRRTVRVAVAGIVFAVLPVALVALPVQKTPALVAYSGNHVLVPVERSFRARATAHSRAVSLTWPARRSRGATLLYEVFEGYGGEGAGTNCKTRRGATNCTLRMHPLGSTDKPAYTATVPAGGWTYRVGVAASWTGAQTESHVTVLSPAVHAIVH